MKRPRSQSNTARSRDEPTIVPARLVDRLSALKLPAGQVHPSSPNHRDRPPKAIRRYVAIRDRAITEGRLQRALRSLAVADLANPPAWAAVKFGSVNAEKAHPGFAAAETVAIDDVGRGAGDSVEWHQNFGVSSPVIAWHWPLKSPALPEIEIVPVTRSI